MKIEDVNNAEYMLSKCIDALDDKKLDEWETEFIETMAERYSTYEGAMFISPKQIEKLEKCYEKVKK